MLTILKYIEYYYCVAVAAMGGLCFTMPVTSRGAQSCNEVEQLENVEFIMQISKCIA